MSVFVFIFQNEFILKLYICIVTGDSVNKAFSVKVSKIYDRF